MSRHLSGDFADEVRTLRYLRNGIAHPAKMPVKTGENSADAFCFRMEREPAFHELAPSCSTTGRSPPTTASPDSPCGV
jgi:hypothetical protein